MFPRWLLALIPDPAARAAANAAIDLIAYQRQRQARAESRRRRRLTEKAERLAAKINAARERERLAGIRAGEALDRARRRQEEG